MKKGPSGAEILLKLLYQNNFLNLVRMNFDKNLIFQCGNISQDNMNDVKTYKLNIGIFQTTLLSFCVTLSMTFMSKMIRLLLSVIFP